MQTTNGQILKPFTRQNYSVTVDTALIEHVLPLVSGNAWKILWFVILHTGGYGRAEAEISFSQINHGVGVKHRATIDRALHELEDKGLIIVKRDTITPLENRATNTYSLNRDFELRISITDNNPGSKNEPISSKNEPVSSSKNEPVSSSKNELHDDDEGYINHEIDLNYLLRIYNSEFKPLQPGQIGIVERWLNDGIPGETILDAIDKAIINRAKHPLSYIRKLVLDTEPTRTEAETNDPATGDDDQANILELGLIIKVDLNGNGDDARRGQRLYWQYKDTHSLFDIANMVMRTHNRGAEPGQQRPLQPGRAARAY